MMHMTFYWGRRVTILFDSWRTDTWTSYFLSLLACFLIAAFYQYMENRRLKFRIMAKKSPTSGVTTPLLPTSAVTAPAKYGGGKYSPARFAETVLFGVNSAIGYMLMLAVMSFNGGVFVAVVVGLGVGYLVFRGGDDDDVLIVDSPCACA